MNLSSLPPRANIHPKEIASFLAISLSKVYELIQSEEIPSLRVGSKTLRVPRDDFIKWLRQNSRGQLELF